MHHESDALIFRQRHRGLIGVKSKMPIRDMSVMSRIYTPGVGAICREIDRNSISSFRYTCRGNSIALISDGSAVFEFGNIGAAAVLPKLEAKSVIFKTFANVDAVPIAIKTQDPYEIIETVRVLAPSFGGICLEGIAAPKCFTVENRVRHAVRVSVLHHEFHASGIIVLAALYNALKVVGKNSPRPASSSTASAPRAWAWPRVCSWPATTTSLSATGTGRSGSTAPWG